MKIVICSGTHDADYMINMFKGRNNELIVINHDRLFASHLTKKYHIPVVVGESYNQDILSLAKIDKADVLIALNDKDTDDLVTCLLAKTLYRVKKCICTVQNPNHVELYKQLGVDSVISSMYLLGNTIRAESSIESLIKTMSVEDDKIVMTEILIDEKYDIANKKISDINFPRFANISCIFRNPNVIIPNGQTLILPKDKLIIVSTPQDQRKIIEFIKIESKVKAPEEKKTATKAKSRITKKAK